MGLLSLALCTGCETNQAKADTVQVFTNTAPPPTVAPAEKAAPIPAPANPAPATVPEIAPAATPVTADATAAAPPPGTNVVVQPAIVPEQMNLAPAMAEVVKLIQAGVSPDVVMAYVTNSTELFNVGSNEILYLHDLGTPAPIITALIHKDSSPEAQARRQALGASQPLPSGVALTTPASNIYPATAAAQAQPIANPPEPTPVDPPASVQTASTQPATQVVVQQPVSVAYFETELAPYGSWVYVSGYGRCWRPTVSVWNAGWRPYSDGGRWLWTDNGWYWYSDYSWGWAPFHYGRWFNPPGLGWVWYPDVHWGPAWVSWRHSHSHYGWAPLPPSARWVHGHGFYHNSISVGIGFEFGLGYADYTFVSYDRFCDRRLSAYAISGHHGHGIYNSSKVVNKYVFKNNTIINNAAGVEPVAAVTRGNVRKVALRDTTDVRDVSGRRERLEADGQTLAVVRPSSGVIASRTPATDSSVRPRGSRNVSETPSGNVSSGRPGPGAVSGATTTRPSAGSQFNSGPAGNSRSTVAPRSETQQPVTRPRDVPRQVETPTTNPGGNRGGNSQPDRSRVRPSSNEPAPNNGQISRPFTPRPSAQRDPIIITGGRDNRSSSATVSAPVNPQRPAVQAPVIQPPANDARSQITRPRQIDSTPPPARIAPPSVAPQQREPVRVSPPPTISRPVNPAQTRPNFSTPVRPSNPNPAPSRQIEAPRSAPSRVAPAPSSGGNRGGGRNDGGNGGGRGRNRE